MPLYSEILNRKVTPIEHEEKIMFILTREPKTNTLKGVNRKIGYRDGVQGYNLVPPMNSKKCESSFSAELFAREIGLKSFELMTYVELQKELSKVKNTIGSSQGTVNEITIEQDTSSEDLSMLQKIADGFVTNINWHS